MCCPRWIIASLHSNCAIINTLQDNHLSIHTLICHTEEYKMLLNANTTVVLTRLWLTSKCDITGTNSQVFPDRLHIYYFKELKSDRCVEVWPRQIQLGSWPNVKVDSIQNHTIRSANVRDKVVLGPPQWLHLYLTYIHNATNNSPAYHNYVQHGTFTQLCLIVHWQHWHNHSCAAFSQLFIPCLWNEQHRTERVLCHLRKQASVQIQESCGDIFCLHGESEERPHCECVPLTLQYKPPRCVWEPSVERCGVVWGKGFGRPLLHSAETNTSEVMNKGRVYRGWRSVSHTHTHTCTPTRTFLDSGLPGSLGLARILCILSNVCYWALSRLQPVPRLPSNAINCRRAYDKHTHTQTQITKYTPASIHWQTCICTWKQCSVLVSNPHHSHPPSWPFLI